MLLLLAANAATMSPSLPPRHSDMAARLLAVHNQARAEVGAAPLHWDPRLAEAAASYGPTLASLGRLQHSSRAQRPGQAENLAMDLDWRGTPESMAGMWIAEKSMFQPGTFPAVTRTGRWEDVAHYTQIIWRGTTHVGCAIHDDNGWSYLVCRYSPKGNADGKTVP